MSGDPPDYYAYLIRLWRTGLDGPWRASLEDARTGERMGFGSLAEAYVYLLAKTGEAARLFGDRDAAVAPDTDPGRVCKTEGVQ